MRNIASWGYRFMGSMRITNGLMAFLLLCKPGVMGVTLFELMFDNGNTGVCSYSVPTIYHECDYSTTTRLWVNNIETSGPLPTQLGLFSALETIYLRGAELTGTIPSEIGNIGTLKEFTISGSPLLTGPLPTEFVKLTSLKTLVFIVVGINGSIDILERMPSLEDIDFATTDLSGTIPSFVNITNLRNLRIAGGDFVGPLPDIFGISRPNMLSLSMSFLTLNPGPTYTQWDKAPQLRRLSLIGTLRNGTIPTEIGLLTNLNNFQIRREGFTGAVPQELANLPSLAFFRIIQTTGITQLPSFGNTANLEIVELSDMPLASTSLAPLNFHTHTKLHTLRVSGCQLKGIIPQNYLSLVDLQYFGLWNNQLTGVLPANAVASTKLEYLILNDNQLTGTIPPLPYSLVQLNLQNNMFQGRVPYTLDVNTMNLFRVGTGSNLACCGMNCTLFAFPSGCDIKCSDGTSFKQNPCPPTYTSSLECLSLYQLLLEENALDPARIQATFTETRTVRGRITERTVDLQALLMEFTTKGCHKLMLVDSARLGL